MVDPKLSLASFIISLEGDLCSIEYPENLTNLAEGAFKRSDVKRVSSRCLMHRTES
jgi:hypothetical protein